MGKTYTQQMGGLTIGTMLGKILAKILPIFSQCGIDQSPTLSPLPFFELSD